MHSTRANMKANNMKIKIVCIVILLFICLSIQYPVFLVITWKGGMSESRCGFQDAG